MSIRRLCRLIIFLAILAPSNGHGQAQVVSPTKLSFTAPQGGLTPGKQTLNVTLTGSWTASSDANWMTLDPATGEGNGTITVTVSYPTLVAGTLYGAITLNPGGVRVPVTFTVITPQAPIPLSANEDWKNACVDKSLNLNGDFQYGVPIVHWGAGQWSVGPSVSTQLIKYDLAKKQAGFNTSVGVGASFRYYDKIVIKDSEGEPLKKKNGQPEEPITISQVKRECRQTSFGERKSYLAAPMFSVTPTIYMTKPTDQSDLAVQPALLFGFFEDILNFGVGWNLTGPAGVKGNVFLLMSIGAGFSF